jgi:Beta/Gamma crystallin
MPNLADMDKITSAAIVLSGIWNVYSEPNYGGQAWTLCDNGGPVQNGTYPTYSNTFQNDTIQSVRPNPESQTDPANMILLCDNTNFTGPSTRLTGPCSDLSPYPIKFTTSALIVGAGSWNLYTGINYEGQVFAVTSTGGPERDGLYPTYDGHFPNDAIKSLRPTS